jgi:hypothetical protein
VDGSQLIVQDPPSSPPSAPPSCKETVTPAGRRAVEAEEELEAFVARKKCRHVPVVPGELGIDAGTTSTTTVGKSSSRGKKGAGCSGGSARADGSSQVDLRITSPRPVYPILVYPATSGGSATSSSGAPAAVDLSSMSEEVSADCSGDSVDVSHDEVEVVIPYWQGALWADMNSSGEGKRLCVSEVRDVLAKEVLAGVVKGLEMINPAPAVTIDLACDNSAIAATGDGDGDQSGDAPLANLLAYLKKQAIEIDASNTQFLASKLM